MSTSNHRSSRAAGRSSSGNQTLVAILAVVLIIAAIAIVTTRSVREKREEAQKIAASDPKVQLQQIESNTAMPPQAKAIAAAQIRAHSGETSARGSTPGTQGQSGR